MAPTIGSTNQLYRATRPTAAELSALAAEQASADLSYQPVGMSLGEVAPPAGFNRLQAARDAGHGVERFDTARSAIIAWAGHRRAGASIEPAQPELVPGSVVALALRVWPLWVTASCRVVRVIDEQDRFGFAYGTLPHHPAIGEESFVAIRDPEPDIVRFEVTAYSRPGTRLARLGGPVGRAFQRFMASRYLAGFVDFDRRP